MLGAGVLGYGAYKAASGEKLVPGYTRFQGKIETTRQELRVQLKALFVRPPPPLFFSFEHLACF